MRTLIVVLLLLVTSPTWAAPIELTGGIIDFSFFAQDVTLIGPDFTFTGHLAMGDSLLGLIAAPGQFLKASLNSPLSGTLTYQGQSIMVQRCLQSVELTCGFISSIPVNVFMPLDPGGVDTLSATVPFVFNGRFISVREFPTTEPILTEPLGFTGSALLTVTIFRNPDTGTFSHSPSFHYEITAVPEPATWLLLASGLGLLLLRRRKKEA